MLSVAIFRSVYARLHQFAQPMRESGKDRQALCKTCATCHTHHTPRWWLSLTRASVLGLQATRNGSRGKMCRLLASIVCVLGMCFPLTRHFRINSGRSRIYLLSSSTRSVTHPQAPCIVQRLHSRISNSMLADHSARPRGSNPPASRIAHARQGYRRVQHRFDEVSPQDELRAASFNPHACVAPHLQPVLSKLTVCIRPFLWSFNLQYLEADCAIRGSIPQTLCV
jgi:hypothetical protein